MLFKSFSLSEIFILGKAFDIFRKEILFDLNKEPKKTKIFPDIILENLIPINLKIVNKKIIKINCIRYFNLFINF